MESKIEFKPENYGKIIELLNAKLSRDPGTGRALAGHSVSLVINHKEEWSELVDEFLGEVETQDITTGARIIMKEGSPVPESLSERSGSQNTHIENLIIHTLDRRTGETTRVCRLDPREVDWAVEGDDTVSFVDGTSGWARNVLYFHPAGEVAAERDAFAFLTSAMKEKEDARVLLVSDNTPGRKLRFMEHLVSEGLLGVRDNLADCIMEAKGEKGLQTRMGTVCLAPPPLDKVGELDAVAVLCDRKRAETMVRTPNTRFFTWEF